MNRLSLLTGLTVNVKIVYGRTTIKINKEQFEQIMNLLDFLDTGIFVSILPDEIIDLNPSDEEIVETANFVCWEIEAILFPKRDLHIKPPKTIGGVRFNFACWVHDELTSACDSKPEVRVKLIMKKVYELQRAGHYLLSEEWAS